MFPLHDSNEQTVAIQPVSEIYDAFAVFNSVETNSSIRPACGDLIVPNFQTLLIIYSDLYLIYLSHPQSQKGAVGRIVPSGGAICKPYAGSAT